MTGNLMTTVIYTATILVLEYIGNNKKPLEVISDLPFWVGLVMLMFILWLKK